MFYLLGLLLVPLLVGGVAFIVRKHKITLFEFVVLEAIALTLAAGGYFVAKWGALQDTEHWNGRVTRKVHDSQGCCHCRQVCDTCTGTDSKGNATTEQCNCRQECDHFRDYFWALDVSTGDRVVIRSCESNRRRVPQAWTKAYKGEPASVAHTYTNYLKADPDTLLNRSAKQEYMNQVPAFSQVYGHYKVNKVMNAGVRAPPGWEKGLREINADLGSKKQVDIVMVFTSSTDPEWADALETKWLYGPKNSLIIVAGADATKIKWVRVVSISDVEALKVSLRDKLTGVALADSKTGLEIINKEVAGKFHRTPMADFEYLSSQFKPPIEWVIALYLTILILSVILVVVFDRIDLKEKLFEGFGGSGWKRRY